MKRCLVYSRDRIFVKSYGFLTSAKNVGKHIGKNISKSLNSKYSQKLLDRGINLQQLRLKFLQKESFKKQGKDTVILLEIKLPIKLKSLKNLSKK